MKRSDAVIAGAESLKSLENSIDKSLIEANEFTAHLLRMRMATGLSAVSGQTALDSIEDGLITLFAARRKFVIAHNELNDFKTLIGCRTVMVGADNDKPIKTTGELQPTEAA
ncbi:hypothetical protein [Asticcacaulis sp. YBE204]|uniref:hypothetical protein n=1 Tax=Asticcacaulis sp. YBE204 TaxID=1282363 RepID=UPI0003C3D251|nr:hypothetical protein [Asticcacaulis sp. YBE204]ESQ79402.1 hypothetical protein AEYBE204_10365 [Asticcacaulis sp. YBE204]